ncbi:MAG: mercury(II) reductase [Chloroflexi bacterium 44-23]|nr:MAG: mercury(II) reductase [Chloroflexi bacterium 44-23]
MAKQRIEFDIRGMTCSSCAIHVKKSLLSVPGVENVDVPGWESGKATVVTDQEVNTKTLSSAVANAGYHASIKSIQNLETPAGSESAAQENVDFDLLVIGGGSGGFAAAIKGEELGYQVGIINGGTIGGTCVNVGCVPSKTLIRAAEAWQNAGHHPFSGVITSQTKLDWHVVRNQKDELVKGLRQKKYVDVLEAYQNIKLIKGYATFATDGSVHVGDKSYRAFRYVIATGAQPRILPIPGLAEAQPLTSTTLMDLDELPKSLIILGGRAVALELGQTMARLGVKVLILQRSTRLVPDHEPEIGRAIQEYLEQEGITVLTGVQIERVSREGEIRTVHAKMMGQSRAFDTDQIMVALGRQPNTIDLGLDHVGVKLDRNGAIIINEYQQTSNPIIYASGDVTPNPDYVYVAAASGALAVSNAMNGNHKPLDLSALPGVVFTDPQIASVGLTEEEARQHGYKVKANTLPLEYVPRALAARNVRGLIKMVTDETSGTILGVHVLAAEAGEVIQTATMAVKFGLKVSDLTETLFPYLTQVEGLKLAALSFTKDVDKLSCCAG